LLTPQKIQDLADPIESIYIAMTNELLVNIGKHITSPTWTHTAAWEIQKLSELGQLTKENAAIINKWIKLLPQEIRDTMEDTRREALEKIEKQMERAAKAGYLTPPMRDSTARVLEEYAQQAADKMNLVNTTMIQSSLEQYQRMVMLTAEEERRAERTQTFLNEAAGNVASGTETRTQALRRAINRISEEGLTGFYDRAGRSWSPEAYVNMDMRTTVHNVAIQSVKNRMEDYNTQVFQVSAHAGARPLCYPYQGKLYSWNNTAGEIETGDGRTWRYEPLNTTSYGQPAGLFGINCGHSPIPIIPGVSIPHAQDFVQPKEENDKQYAESQEQRALERKIRAAKRAVEMGDDSPEAKARVKAAQEQMRQFIKETGRTRRPDRESLYGGKKAKTPPKEQRPERKNVNSQLTKPKVEPVKVADSTVSKIMAAQNIDYKPVTRHTSTPTEPEIINALAGGDKTRGSCVSVGLAYCGQKNGLNVLDFRGGDSQNEFSHEWTLEHLREIPNISWDEQHGHYYQTTGNQLLKRVQSGKQYWFVCGRHAAIVQRNADGKLQYLEMQSQHNSGWHDFDGNVRYTLSSRFGAPSYKFVDALSFMFDVESVKDSPEFAKILGYINTAEDEQKKGKGGTIK
jgi:hypothetical protein